MSEIILNGPAGRLEARYVQSCVSGAPLALILHPNPQQGGTMNHKVSYALFRAFSMRGFSTLRFNFRGVGRSQGAFDNGEGELSDAAAALDCLQNFNPNVSTTWVAGFSFGAWIGMQLLMRRPEIRGFVAVSPPANIYDFNFLAPCPTPGLILQGDQDTIVSEESVSTLVHKLNAQKGVRVDYRVLSGSNHFFNKATDDIIAHVHDHLDKNVHGYHAPAQLARAA